MYNELKNKEFNVRVTFDNEGAPRIGMVQSFYQIGSNCVDILPVDILTRVQIAGALGAGVDVDISQLNRSSGLESPTAKLTDEQFIDFIKECHPELFKK